MPSSDAVRPIAQNRRARHEFEILEELECGIELTGTEVKSLRAGHASIAEAYGLFKKGELFLVGSHIPEYRQGNVHNHPPVRDRRLLAHRRQLRQWEKKVREKGITAVPLALYFRGPRVKVAMALVRGKKLYDKRQTQKERAARREIDRAMSRRR